MEKFAHPFKFDGHGVHYIRHFDYESPVKEKEIAFVVNVDGLPPKSSFTLQGAPSYFNKKLYFGKNLQGTLSAIDQMSGVETTQQSVNGAAYATYGQPISFAQEGDFSVKFYSVDHVGNAEKVQSKEFVVDITSPESTHSVNIDHINGTILSPRSLIKLSSSDQSSGVKSIKFMINEGKETPYAREFGLIGLADGNHLLKYGATDQVKNEKD